MFSLTNKVLIKFANTKYNWLYHHYIPCKVFDTAIHMLRPVYVEKQVQKTYYNHTLWRIQDMYGRFAVTWCYFNCSVSSEWNKTWKETVKHVILTGLLPQRCECNYFQRMSDKNVFPDWFQLTYFEVVAPPMSKGIRKPCRSISLDTCIISSKEGVMRPDRPTISNAEQVQ